MKRTEISYEFVEFMPADLEGGQLYVSIQYATAVHLCACGCGTKVVTPISPAEWHLLFDGDSVSLSPSIGNWQFPCQSHYWIRHGQIKWAKPWSKEKIELGRAQDERDLQLYFADRPAGERPPSESRTPQPESRRLSDRLKRLFH